MKENTPLIALVGTPNSGKTSLFNVLSGLNQKVGNFPGITVDRKLAEINLANKQKLRLMDLPGTDSLYASSQDESITCGVLKNPQHPDHPDKVIVVADATQLSRGLLLCSQVMDLKIPLILVLNMADRMAEEKISLNEEKLSQLLGIPVFSVSALKKSGLKKLKQAMGAELKGSDRPFMRIPAPFLPLLGPIKEKLNTDSDYMAYQNLLDGESLGEEYTEVIEQARKEAKLSSETSRRLISNELLVRLDKVDGLLTESKFRLGREELSLSDKLDEILAHKIWGYVIFIAILMLVFQAIFSWAEGPMGLIEGLTESVSDLIKNILPEHWSRDLITDGIIAGFGGVIVFIPQIAFLFFFITVMEESGYMARVVYLMDRIMRPFGFSGKSVIPLMGGMACAIPSIMMTRNIPNRSERLITVMVTPLMSCSARIPVYTLLIAMFIPSQSFLGFDQRGLYMTALYFLGFFAALLIAFAFKKALKYKSDRVFVMELPTYRMPRWKNVGITVWQKSLDFVLGVWKIMLGISIVLWFLVAYGPGNQMQEVEQEYTELLSADDLTEAEVQELEMQKGSKMLEASYAAILGKSLEPVIKPLGYDWKIGISLITSFAAREVFVGTMSIIYQQDDPDAMDGDEAQEKGRVALIDRMRAEKKPDGSPLYTPAVVLSLIIFFAIAMQCMSTLAVTQKELGNFWVFIMLTYLTLMAYVAAFVAYQVMS
ncbi:MAG: ferrous iron transport protein B [Bacteroidia bacterium]|nr:ferrous iron transport protein B [Bacteroidia bacterium]